MENTISSDNIREKRPKLGQAVRQKLPYCEAAGKVAYSLKDAQTTKNRRYESDRIPLRIYKCPFGNHYHLTSRMNDRQNYEGDKEYHYKTNHRSREFRRKNHFRHKRY